MAWRGPRTAYDPTLSTSAWAKVKKHWIALKHPVCRATVCYLPGIPISYTKPFTSPASFNCGHIVPRWKAKAMGWTVEQINALENSRPEHRRCNVRDGARQGQRRQQAKLVQRMAQTQVLNTSGRW